MPNDDLSTTMAQSVGLSGIFGSLEKFDPKECRFSTYESRFRQILKVNNVNDADQVAVFNTVLGNTHYQLLSNLVSPKDPATLSLDEAMKALRDHFEPATNVIAECYKFHTRRQREGEDVAEFAQDLKRLSNNCQFDAYLDKSMLIQFIIGIRNEQLKKRFLNDPPQKFENAYQLAIQWQEVERNIPLMTKDSQFTEGSIHHVRNTAPNTEFNQRRGSTINNRGRNFNNTRGRSSYSTNTNTNGNTNANNNWNANFQANSCHRCGDSDHWAKYCPFKNAECRTCHKIGHLAKVCKSSTYNRGNGRISHIDSHSNNSDVEDYIINSVRVANDSDDSIKIPVTILSKELSFSLDTGSKFMVIKQNTWHLLGKPKLNYNSLSLKDCQFKKITVLGSFYTPITVQDETKNVEIIVAGQKFHDDIFGLQLMKQFTTVDFAKIFASYFDTYIQNNAVQIQNSVKNSIPIQSDNGWTQVVKKKRSQNTRKVHFNNNTVQVHTYDIKSQIPNANINYIPNSQNYNSSINSPYIIHKYIRDDFVWVRNYKNGPNWIPGRVLYSLGLHKFRVGTYKGIWTSHYFQLRPRQLFKSVQSTTTDANSKIDSDFSKGRRRRMCCRLIHYMIHWPSPGMKQIIQFHLQIQILLIHRLIVMR